MEDETKYPSVDMAYDLAVQSYDSLHRRWDAINGLFHALLSVAITLALAMPILARALSLSLGTYWALAALGVFVLNVLCCLYGRHSDSLVVINPKTIYDRYLHLSHWEFQKNVTYFAGKDFTTNVKAVKRKWTISLYATVLLCLGVSLVFLWILYSDLR